MLLNQVFYFFGFQNKSYLFKLFWSFFGRDFGPTNVSLQFYKLRLNHSTY
jgi:hypothetical protein